MASFEGIKGSPIAAFKHNLRERDRYINEDIDQARTKNNYTISPGSHGTTTKECMDYYDGLMENVYNRGKSTMTAGQWVVTAPPDLPQKMREEFFRTTYDFLCEFLFDGDDTRCLLAQVHEDEAGESHMHFMFVFPETENEKYVPIEKKCISGIKQAQQHFGLNISKEQANEIFLAVKRYEKSHVNSRERYAISDIKDILGLKRDDARWVFTRVRRLESEIPKKKLVPKDKFLSRDRFNEFHPAFQKYIEEHGFDCRVYKGGTGINMTVEQLKEMTRNTGYRLIDEREIERLRGIERELIQSRNMEMGRWDQ